MVRIVIIGKHFSLIDIQKELINCQMQIENKEIDEVYFELTSDHDIKLYPLDRYELDQIVKYGIFVIAMAEYLNKTDTNSSTTSDDEIKLRWGIEDDNKSSSDFSEDRDDCGYYIDFDPFSDDIPGFR